MANTQIVNIPDIGTDSTVDVIEVFISPGDTIKKDDSLITLESDKATMDIPAPFAGKVKEVKVKVGDKVSKGTVILLMDAAEGDAPKEKIVEEPTKTSATPPASAAKVVEEPVAASIPAPAKAELISVQSQEFHSGPAVRRFARELGVDLSAVTGSGPKQRILKEDVQQFVKARMQQPATGSGFGLPPAPEINFAEFGEVHQEPLNKIKKLTGLFTHRSWITIPHVTNFDEADITDLEAFRKDQQAAGHKLTPLVFIMKAVVSALKAFPTFNSSLDAKGENLVVKHYFHLGVAVDTPNGLVVPVIRNVDQKGLLELATELAVISQKAREKSLMPNEMKGNCFTISSLGGIGGTGFTPIVNGSDVAILGVSKSKMQPVYQDGNFVPRLILPLSLSYDHRVIDGAQAARFSRHLSDCLSDLRQLLL